ncbi:MAG: crosslink repair DNA glycosylase YcaQ family protein [Verrucomicrobiota bacterium]
MPPALVVSRTTARRFARAAVGLDAPHRDLGAALAHHGYIQIDPINICGRMHDLILRNRIAGYREGDLMRFLHGADATPPLASAARPAFEHHVPGTGILVAFPLEAWPHLLGEMQRRSRRRGPWSGRLTPREEKLAEHLLSEIAARGPLGSEDFDDERRARRVWGAAKLAKATLQKLFFHGRLLIAQRFNNRRRYDLPERVLPPSVLAQPAPPAAETARWLALLKLRQRRLVTLKRDELRLVSDAVQPLTIEGCPTVYCLKEDVPLLETIRVAERAEEESPTTSPSTPATTPLALPRLLAPLDPLIYDRRLTAMLWDFDYTWEVYTPPAKRVRGYYALPILSGLELVGHVDPKADRAARRLHVVSRRIRRGHKVAATVGEFARWLGLRR